MNRAFIIVLAFLACALTSCETLSKPDQDARAAAVDWLAIVDRGDYHAAFIDRPARIIAAGNEADFVRLMKGRRGPLGRAKTREFIRVAYSKTLEGAPDGNYGFMKFKSTFEHKATTYEFVTVSSESGRWQVTGYRFR